MKITVAIDAPTWQSENAEQFLEWLQDELDDLNMYSDDDARLIHWIIEDTENQ